MKARSKPRPESTAGFTLLEVMIAMAILVFLSFAIYEATTSTFRLRETLSSEGDFHNNIRLAMGIMQRDFALLYSPVNSAPQPTPSPSSPPNVQQMGVLMSDDLGATSNYWSPALDQTGVRPSRFQGSDDKVSFVSASHIRIYRDSPESEFAKISYELKSDSRSTSPQGTKVLVKTENPNAFSLDDARDTAKRSYEILTGVKSISYSYYQRDGDTWKVLKSWDSDQEGTKNKYPDIVEIKIEVIGAKKQVFEGTFRFRPEIPFNGLDPSS